MRLLNRQRVEFSDTQSMLEYQNALLTYYSDQKDIKLEITVSTLGLTPMLKVSSYTDIDQNLLWIKEHNTSLN